MKRITGLASILALSLVVLALPAVTSAQWRDRDRDDDYNGRNDDYRNGRWGRNDDYRNGRSGRNLRGTVESLHQRARNFEQRLDRADNRRGGRYNRYDNLEELADRFVRATGDLRDEYGRGRNLNNSRDEARRVLDIGSQIESAMYQSGGRNVRQWDQISRDLRLIANEYGLDYYNNRNRRNGTGDWRNRVPFPLPF